MLICGCNSIGTDRVDEGRLVVQNALKNTRLQIGEGVLETEQWYQKLDEEARAQYRYSGAIYFRAYWASSRRTGQWKTRKPRSLGYEYASRGWRSD